MNRPLDISGLPLSQKKELRLGRLYLKIKKFAEENPEKDVEYAKLEMRKDREAQFGAVLRYYYDVLGQEPDEEIHIPE